MARNAAGVREPWVTVVRQSSTEFRVRIQLTYPAAAGEYAEWKLRQLSTSVWTLHGLSVFNAAGTEYPLEDTYDLVGGASVWEWACAIKKDADPVDVYSASDGAFLGNGHLNQSLTSRTLLLDGADVSGLAVGSSRKGRRLVQRQVTSDKLPRAWDGDSAEIDGVTVVGTSVLIHTFDRQGCLVYHSHDWDEATYDIKTFYAHMCPTTDDNNGVNRTKVGTNADYTVTGSGGVQNANTQHPKFEAWHASAHNYRLQMILNADLTKGGPDVTNDWSRAGSTKLLQIDTASNCKGYAAYNEADGAPPATSAHQALYRVYKSA